MRVLITDSDNRSALAATRSLARNGCFVVTAGERRASLAAASKHSSAFVPCPSPARDPAGFTSAIIAAATEHAIDVLMPIGEISTLLLTEHRGRLPARCRLPFAASETIEQASDKAAMVTMARQLGVPVPETLIVANAAEAEAGLDALTYPVVIKPARSRVRTSSGWNSTRVSYARSADHVMEQLRTLSHEQYPVLLQERISGPGIGFFACYDQGKPVAFFAHRRLREKPPTGGVSVLSESIPLTHDLLTYGTRLLEHLRWHGVAMVEFKRDERDDSLRLMEINARFWGSLQLAITSGVDFPWMLAQIAMGSLPATPAGYRVGVRSRWLLGDLDVMLLLLRRSRHGADDMRASRLRALMNFLRFWERDLHYEVLSLDDPRPALIEARHWLLRR